MAIGEEAGKMAEKNSEFEQRLRDGKPLMECLIDLPFKVVVTETGVELDAPCLQFNQTNALGVLRLTLTPAAALRLRDTLNQLSFSETVSSGSSTLQ